MHAYLKADGRLLAEIIPTTGFRGERGRYCSGGGGRDGNVLGTSRRLDDHAVEHAGRRLPSFALLLRSFGHQRLEKPPPLLLASRAQKLIPLRARVGDCNRNKELGEKVSLDIRNDSMEHPRN